MVTVEHNTTFLLFNSTFNIIQFQRFILYYNILYRIMLNRCNLKIIYLGGIQDMTQI